MLTPDPVQAPAYDLIAARAGFALAQEEAAGLCLRRGEPRLAAEWMARAAAQGWPDALTGMATLHNGKNGLPHDPVIVAAFFDLFLGATQANDAQRAYLGRLRASLSPTQQQSAGAIAARFRPAPTALTVKSLSGQRAAATLTRQQ